MADLDPKWQVPDSFDVEDRAFALPPPGAHPLTGPVLTMLSTRALEDQATGDGILALYAWQLIAGAGTIANDTIARLAATPNLSGIELLLLGHAYAASGDTAAFETAQRARKILKQPVTAQSVDASLLLAATALPHGADKVKTLLDMLEAELPHGTELHRAVHALIRAAVDPDPARLASAHERFLGLDDGFGLANCALVAHAHELAGAKRPAVLRGYLEHAIYRFESDGRPEWAARTITRALVPSLPAGEVAELLGRAAALAVQARSQPTLASVFRSGAKLGYSASLTTLDQFDPPVFSLRAAGATAEPVAEKPKKAPAAKKKKKA